MMKKVLSVFAIVGLMSLLSVQAAVDAAKLIKDGKVDKKAVEQAMAEGADISSITEALVKAYPQMASDLNQQLSEQFPEQAEAIEMTATTTVLKVARQDAEDQLEEGATEIEDDTERDERGKVLGRAAAAGDKAAKEQFKDTLSHIDISKSQDKQRMVKDIFRTVAGDADSLSGAIVAVSGNSFFNSSSNNYHAFSEALEAGIIEALKSGETTGKKLTEAANKAKDSVDDGSSSSIKSLTDEVTHAIEDVSDGYDHE